MSLYAQESGPAELTIPRSIPMDKACKILGVSRRTVYYWIRDGRLQTTRTRCGSQRVLTDSLKVVWTKRLI